MANGKEIGVLRSGLRRAFQPAVGALCGPELSYRASRFLIAVSCLVLTACRTEEPKDGASSTRHASTTPRLEFTRLIAHWAGYADAGYLPFVDDVKPEIAQVGFYGAHFWSLADTEFGKGYPANLPVKGHRECGEWFERLNSELHRRGVKVVGHFNVKFLVGDPEGPKGARGFFRFYREQWDEHLLGAKPVADALDLLEKDKFGKPLSENNYSIGGMREYWACLNNPHWRQVLKSWVRCGIARGVDGFISNYFYRHDCHCEYCVTGFRAYLAGRFSATELKERFAITNLSTHEFEEIVAWHDPEKSTPLRREMLRFSQVSNKQAFDEVFVQFGRSIKPDLIVAQWNHFGDFSQISGDERCLLPAELWGRDEDYLWYSTGGANATDVKAGVLGEATLQARYIRGAFEDKPFTLGKYENVRIRAAIAELAANGGAPMGFYTSFEDTEARRELVRYYGFLKRNESLYRANEPHGEALLLFPRSRVHEGEVAAVSRFKQIGKRLLDAHVLFDIAPDDIAKRGLRSHDLVSAGLPGRAYSRILVASEETAALTNLDALLASGLSRFEAPATIRVSASRPAAGQEITLHFVNYNREEPADKRIAGKSIKDEMPIRTQPFEADFVLPTMLVSSGRTAKVHGAMRVIGVEFLAPEQEGSKELEFRQLGQRIRFVVPEFLVYGVVRVQYK